ncbi:MAG: M48 family metallopeptidase [Flammeovirgaceae bacterium]
MDTTQTSPYAASLSNADLNSLVYDQDRDRLLEFLKDPAIQKAYDHLKWNNPIVQSRKHLLKTSLRLTPKLAPKLYAIGMRCAQALSLKVKLEFYVYQEAKFNAACYPPTDDTIYIMITSGLLENFTEDELAFVIGHEIGHAIFLHHEYPANSLMDVGKEYLSPLHAMKLFAWKRDNEISADRAGLLCCQDFNVAAKTFFKLSSGVTSDRLDFNLEEYIDQYRELETELAESSSIDPEDWYKSHPFSPMRIKALELFEKSDTYQRLTGKGKSMLSEQDMESKIRDFMTLMEPSQLQESHNGQKVQEYMFMASYLIAISDDQIVREESDALSGLVKSDQVYNQCRAKIQGMSFEEVKQEVVHLSNQISTHLSHMEKLNLIRDLAVVAKADGHIKEAEVNVMHNLCHLLKIKPNFADQVMYEAGQDVD